MPIFLEVVLAELNAAFNLNLDPGVTSMAQLLVFGGLIIFFLIVEPHGLARLWQITKEKLRLWPFPY
jgi:branched-chain amino acid transport system permease protein